MGYLSLPPHDRAFLPICTDLLRALVADHDTLVTRIGMHQGDLADNQAQLPNIHTAIAEGA